MARKIDELGETLLAQLSDIVAGGDETVVASPNQFITWCKPGIAFDASDFEFAVHGITSSRDAAVIARLGRQASTFSMVVDFVPEAGGVYALDQQLLVHRRLDARLSYWYGEILRQARISRWHLPVRNKETIDANWNLLIETHSVDDFITGEATAVTRLGNVLLAYYDAKSNYLDHALAYNQARVAAQGATGPVGEKAVSDWHQQACQLRLKVNTARQAWATGGFRDKVEQMTEFINETTQRDARWWRQKLLQHHEQAFQGAKHANERFYRALPIPANFATSGRWTPYRLVHDRDSSVTTRQRTSWLSGGKTGYALRCGDGVRMEHRRKAFSVSDFELSFELAKVLIVRPGFCPGFFRNRGWTLDHRYGWPCDEMPSDGGNPPAGMFVGYSTQALVVRSVRIRSPEFLTEYESCVRAVGTRGSIEWGPFRLGGHFAARDEHRRVSASIDADTIKVHGMQIIGFVNHKLGRVPNPMTVHDRFVSAALRRIGVRNTRFQ